jgi:electron transfer flavoprotein alpha subunit
MNITILGKLIDSKLSLETQQAYKKVLKLEMDNKSIELLFLNNDTKIKSLPLPLKTTIKLYNNITGNDIKSNYVELMDHYQKHSKADYVVVALGDLNEDVVPLFGERYNLNSFIDCTGIQYQIETHRLLLQKPEYSGNVIKHYHLAQKAIIGFRTQQSDKTVLHQVVTNKIQYIDYSVVVNDPAIKREYLTTNSTQIEDADFCIVCGYGVGSKANVDEIIRYGQSIGAVVCGTKKIIDSGWLPMNLLIGQTGHIISPSLCITIGVSGAAPLLNGILGSKKIIAINKDKDARIFSYSDYGIVGDYKDVISKGLSTNENH